MPQDHTVIDMTTEEAKRVVEWPEEVVERVGRRIAPHAWSAVQHPRAEKRRHSAMYEARAAITALASLLPGGRPALLDLIEGRAVVMPKEMDAPITAAYLGALENPVDPEDRTAGWHRIKAAKRYRAMVAASPYAPPPKQGSQ